MKFNSVTPPFQRLRRDLVALGELWKNTLMQFSVNIFPEILKDEHNNLFDCR